MFSIAAIALANEVHGKDWRNKAIKKTIENRYHHLGDDYMDGFIVPDYEGTYWEKNFWLPKRVLKFKEIAFAKFFARHVDITNLIVNGIQIPLDNTYDGESMQLLVTYAIPLPLEILYAGKNTIGFEVKEWAPDKYDDMEFGNLEIWFQ